MNATDDIVDWPRGNVIAGCRRRDGKGFINLTETLMQDVLQERVHIKPASVNHTTIGQVATNAIFNKSELARIAMMANTGTAKVVNPYYTPEDGDPLFAVPTRKANFDVEVMSVVVLAAQVVGTAIQRAVKMATSIPGFPAYGDYTLKLGYQQAILDPERSSYDTKHTVRLSGEGNPMSILEKYVAWVGATFISIVLLMWYARPATATEPVDPDEQVKQMGRGVNILGYDPIWDDASKARFKEEHFKLIHDAGFHTVRINLHALQRLGAENGYKLGDTWLNTLDWAVKNALANHLLVILDLHNYEDIAQDPEGYKPRFLAYWHQISAHFQGAPNTVLFEILNEPNGKLTPKLWNEFLREALGIIRASNPTRTVVIGPPFWNGIDHLKDLVLPEEDRNIIVTVHYYEPMRFTHQGAPWEKETAHLSGVTWGKPKEEARVEDDFARVQKWSQEHRRPILLGEFGAYDKAPMESRTRYVAKLARTAESLGWAWTYWQFDSDFIVYDIDKERWVEPIRKALLP